MDEEISPTQVNSEPQQEKPLNSHTDSNWTRILLIVLILLVILLIGLVIRALPENKTTKLPPTPTPTTSLPEEALPSSSPIPKSWKTYENTYYGYSIRYPDNWTILADIGDCASGPDGLAACLPKPDTKAGITIDKDYGQKIYKYPIGNMRFEMPTLIDYDGAYYLKGSSKKITISGNDATIYTMDGQTVITIEKNFNDGPNPNDAKTGILITFFYDHQGSEIYNDQLAIVSSLVIK